MTDELPPGTLFGEYTIEELVGEGGMGLVYRALQTSLDRRVALKIIAPRLSEDISFRDRFRREARKAAAVDHPSIVPIYASGEVDGRPYLSMRFVQGTDLGALLKAEGRLAPARTLAIADQIAGALDAAHAEGLIHRDVKPANILIEPSARGERAYLTDFGLTRGQADTSLTQTGTFMGSPLYMSPEQIQGGVLDARADQYSLACVIYEAFTGSPPFLTEGQLQAIYAHLHTPPPQLTATLPDLPAAVDSVLARALAKSAEERYASCREFVADLRRAAVIPAGSPVGALPAARPGAATVVTAVPAGAFTLPGTRPEVPARRRILLGAGALVIVAAIVVAIVLVTSGSGHKARHLANTGTTTGTSTTSTTGTGSTTGTSTTSYSSLPTTPAAIIARTKARNGLTSLSVTYKLVYGNQSGTMTIDTNFKLIHIIYTSLKGVSQTWAAAVGGLGLIPNWWCDRKAGKWACYKGVRIPKSADAFTNDFEAHSVNFQSEAIQYGFDAKFLAQKSVKVSTAEQAGNKVACLTGSLEGHPRGLCTTRRGLVTQLYLTPKGGSQISETASSVSTSAPKNAFSPPGPYV